MFTGIIEGIGRVEAVQTSAGGARLVVETSLATGDTHDTPIGASVAVQGACLTVTHNRRGRFDFDVSLETLSLTTVGGLRSGSRVHLERALPLGGRLDGHLVQGHIDGSGELIRNERAGDGWVLTYRIPEALTPFVVPKGSIAIDGVSLTVATLAGLEVSVAVVPLTASSTLLVQGRVGQKVNLETDIIGKYVARLMGFGVTGGTSAAKEGLSLDFLARHGFGGGGHR